VQGYTNRAQGIHASVPHELRRGGDPGLDKADARKAPTVKELCGRFMDDHSKPHNKPRTQAGYQYQIDTFVIPAFGQSGAVPPQQVCVFDALVWIDGVPVAAVPRMARGPRQCRHVRAWPGIYRRSVMLASGRYAMFDDGMGFSLVSWKPVVEQRL